MSHLYFNELLEDAHWRSGRVAVIGGEARHAVTVNRVRQGEQLSIGDGRGRIGTGTVLTASPDEVVLELAQERIEAAPTPALWLVQALAKQDRDELAVQMATELGVDAVAPWQAERSISRWRGEKIDKGMARWRSIVREASKQSLRARIPEVSPPWGLQDAAAAETLTVVLDPAAEPGLSGLEADRLSGIRRILLVVGPEGGVSPAESARLEAAGALRMRLGAQVLRTSTAGAAALAVLNVRLGRW